MSISYDNSVELVKLIMELLGMNTGIFNTITSVIKLGHGISDDNKLSDKQKFIQTLTCSIHDTLQSDGVSESVHHTLKETFRKHFVLQELIDYFEDHEGYCQFLSDKVYSKIEQQTHEEFQAYRMVLMQIVEQIYENLKLFYITKETQISILKRLWSFDSMKEIYSNIKAVTTELLNYENSYAQFFDNAMLPPISTNHPNKFYYLNGKIKFYGRTEELQLIREFLQIRRRYDEETPDVHIWSIAGCGGVGKSKFARHIAEHYKRDCVVIWLEESELEQLLAIHKSYPYNKPILFICDYANHFEEKLALLIKQMRDTDYTTHFLLIERSEQWYDSFLNNHQELYFYAYRREDKGILSALNLSSYSLDNVACKELLDNFAEAFYPYKTLTDTEKSQIIESTYILVDDCNLHCLFLLLTADAYLDNGEFREWDAKALVTNYLDRSRKKLLEKYDNEVVTCGYRLLALATMFDGLDLSKEDYPEAIQKDIAILYEKFCDDCNAITEFLRHMTEHTVNGEFIKPLIPDLVGEYHFLIEFKKLRKKTYQSWCSLLLENEADKTSFIRCLMDWPNDELTRDMLLRIAEVDAENTARILYNTIVNLWNSSSVEKFLSYMKELYKNHKNPTIASLYSHCITHYFIFADTIQKRNLLAEALRIVDSLKDNAAVGAVYNNIGMMYKTIDEYKLSMKYYLESVNIEKTNEAKNDLSLATTINNIGMLFMEFGKFDKALKQLRNSLKIRKRILGIQNLDTAQSYNNIGLLY